MRRMRFVAARNVSLARGVALALAAAPAAAQVTYSTHRATLAAEQGLAAAAVSGAGEIAVLRRTAQRERHVLAWFDAHARPLGEVVLLGLLDPAALALAGEPGFGRGSARLWISDAGLQRVVEFGPEGNVVRSFGRPGAGDGELNEPRGLTWRDGVLYVADRRNDRVARFDEQGGWLGAIGGPGSKVGELRAPCDVALDRNGALWIADTGNHRLQRFGAPGSAAQALGGYGEAPGLFSSPSGIDIVGERVFVADRDNHRIQSFDLEGRLTAHWGEHALRPREANGKLHYPDGVCVSSRGEFLLALERFEDRAQVFLPTISDVGELRPLELPQSGGSSTHYGVGLDVDGPWLAVVEPQLPGFEVHDLSTLSAAEEPLQFARWSARGESPGRFAAPSDVAVDFARGRLAVCDPELGRIAVFGVRAVDPAEPRFDPLALKLLQSLDTRRVAWPPDSGLRAPFCAERIARDAGGAWLALDRTNRVVVALDERGQIRALWNGGDEALLDPIDLCASQDGATILVADRLAGAIVGFDAARSGSPSLFRWSDVAREPSGVCAAPDGGWFVSDDAEHCVRRLGSDGSLVWSRGSRGLGALEFTKPRCLAFGALNDARWLFAMDWGNHRLQILEPDGGFRLALGNRLFTRPANRR